MLTVKKAVSNTAAYLKDMIPNVSNIQLEEIESVNSDKNWAITLSYNDNEILFGGKNYKIFKVRKSDGEILSMKIRSVRQ